MCNGIRGSCRPKPRAAADAQRKIERWKMSNLRFSQVGAHVGARAVVLGGEGKKEREGERENGGDELREAATARWVVKRLLVGARDSRHCRQSLDVPEIQLGLLKSCVMYDMPEKGCWFG